MLASRPTGKKLTGKQSTLPQLRNVQLEPVAADATSAAQPASSGASSSRPPQRTVAEPSTSARASANGGYRDDFRRKLQMASEGNMDNIRKMVLEQMRSNDPETKLPYTHDLWLSTSLMWIRFHHVPRSTMFVPTEVELQDGPPQEELGNGRMTMVLTDAGDQWHEDTWDFNDSNAKRDIGVTFTGATCFERKEHEMFEPLPEAEEGDVQARVARGLSQPKQPTELERAEHLLTHLPFRSWCTHCVQAKSRQNHSAKLRTKQPVLQMDYSFITDPSENQLTLLNVHDALSGLGMSCVVPNKGYSVYARAELRRFVLEAGRTFGALQCDPEPSLKAVAEEVTSDLGGLSLRTSAVEWKQAQGAVGNTQQLLYAQIRTLRKDLQERYGREIELASPIMTWLVRHSQWLLNRYAIRSDGLTPFERRWSRRYTSAICRFGEVVLFRVPGRVPKAELAWQPGLWLGRDTTSDMHIIGTTSGVTKTRSMRRFPSEQQVDVDMLKDFVAKPWDPRGRSEETDDFVLPPVPAPAALQDGNADDSIAVMPHAAGSRKREPPEADVEDEQATQLQRVGPAPGDLKRDVPDELPESRSKLQRISAIVEDDFGEHVLDHACISAITTKDGLEVPVCVNADEGERTQELRALQPSLWYETEFPRELEVAGMDKEMNSMRDFGVYEEVKVDELPPEKVASAISTKWVKRFKGDSVRCRLVARGFDQVSDADDNFASTPSLVTLKLLLLLAITKNWYILAGDVSTAFLNALMTDEVFVIPPGEYYPKGGVLWRLRRAMYGLKNAPRLWQDHFASVMADLGFVRLKTDPNLYFNAKHGVYALCYVDDLLLFGDELPCKHLFEELQKRVLLRKEGVLDVGSSVNFLGRCIARRAGSIEISMPSTYIEKMLSELDMMKCRVSTTPGTDSLRKKIESEDLLTSDEHRLYRRLVGQLLWLSSVRPDIQFATKELSRGLSQPTQDHLHKLKVLLRYLSGTKEAVLQLCPKVTLPAKVTSLDLDVYVDSDWAGCAQSRRSTSGVALYFLGSYVTSISRTHQTVALSSGEAELYAIGLGVSEGLFVRSLLLEGNFSQKVNFRVHTDSTAGKSMASRFGASRKTKHVELRFLYVQELVASGTVVLKKVAGTSNPSDVMTKYVSRDTLLRHLATLGVTLPFGRML